MKQTALFLALILVSGCRTTTLKLCYPDCVRVAKYRKPSKSQHFSTDKQDYISRLNYAPLVHPQYDRYRVKVKGTWVALKVQKAKQDKAFRAKVVSLIEKAQNSYKPKLQYLDMARHYIRYVSKNLAGGEKSILLTAAYEIMKEKADMRLGWELDRLQVVSTLEDCGRKQRKSNLLLMYNTRMTAGKVIPLSGRLSPNKGGLTHLEYKIARKHLMDLFYPGTLIVFRWKVIMYFNSTSSYLAKSEAERLMRPGVKNCRFSFTEGGQKCE